MKEYKDLISRILSNGKEYKDRTGQGTLAVFGETIKVNLKNGFPIVTARKIAFKQAVGELTAFLRGYTKKSEFQSVGCNYWDKFDGPDIDDLGPIYGKQWVHWECPPFGKDSKTFLNQINVLVAHLKNEPHSRRHILTTWNPGELNQMVLPPCHLMAQFNVHNNTLDCIVTMRSCDIMLGLPYDLIVYALLQHILAYQCKYQIGTLQFNLANAHIYLPHVMDAIRFEKLEPFKAPKLAIVEDERVNVWNFEPNMVWLENYNHGPEMKFKLFV